MAERKIAVVTGSSSGIGLLTEQDQNLANKLQYGMLFAGKGRSKVNYPRLVKNGQT